MKNKMQRYCKIRNGRAGNHSDRVERFEHHWDEASLHPPPLLPPAGPMPSRATPPCAAAPKGRIFPHHTSNTTCLRLSQEHCPAQGAIRKTGISRVIVHATGHGSLVP